MRAANRSGVRVRWAAILTRTLFDVFSTVTRFLIFLSTPLLLLLLTPDVHIPPLDQSVAGERCVHAYPRSFSAKRAFTRNTGSERCPEKRGNETLENKKKTVF